MSWNLFIDDERTLGDIIWAPQQVQEKYRNEAWLIARNSQDVLDMLVEFGMPCYISFDHDLGKTSGTGHDIAKMLVDTDMTTFYEEYRFPKNFDFYVHSQNPVGKANIKGFLTSYLKQRYSIWK